MSDTVPPVMEMSAREKEILKIVLGGESIVDDSQLFLSSEEEVDRFLKINEYDVNLPKDRDRLLDIQSEAAGYLKNYLHFDLPQSLTRPARLSDILLAASQLEDQKLQRLACPLLKTMNTIAHIDGRELLFSSSIRRRDLAHLAQDKIERELFTLTKKGIPHLKYKGGRKQRESLITKLLSKENSLDGSIGDRLRYRVVVPTKEEVVRVILHLFETILPYNMVIPGASKNEIIGLKAGTGGTYKVLEFQAEIPLRLDGFLGSLDAPIASLGRITYLRVEFQIVDEETDRQNSQVDYASYKERQRKDVAGRLSG